MKPDYADRARTTRWTNAIRRIGGTAATVGIMLGAVIGSAIGAAFLIGLFMLVGPLLGALAGWVVGWFFGATILYVLGQFGLHGVEMWQLGMTLGFVGGFFKAIQTNSTTTASK